MNINNLKLEDLCLIRIYKLFYLEILNLTEGNIETKIQCMTFLLSKYDIHLTPKFNEPIKFEFDYMVFSNKINDWIKKINFDFQEQIMIEKEVINDYAIKKITIIANTLNEYLNQYETSIKLEKLIELCKIIYVAEMFIGYDFTVESISKNEKIDLQSEEIKNYIKILNKIDKNLMERW